MLFYYLHKTQFGEEIGIRELSTSQFRNYLVTEAKKMPQTGLACNHIQDKRRNIQNESVNKPLVSIMSY